MSKSKKYVSLLTTLATLIAPMALVGCGVRGRPQPPLTPAQIGRGQPTFTKGSEEFAFPSVPSPDATPQPKKPRPTGDVN